MTAGASELHRAPAEWPRVAARLDGNCGTSRGSGLPPCWQSPTTDAVCCASSPARGEKCGFAAGPKLNMSRSNIGMRISLSCLEAPRLPALAMTGGFDVTPGVAGLTAEASRTCSARHRRDQARMALSGWSGAVGLADNRDTPSLVRALTRFSSATRDNPSADLSGIVSPPVLNFGGDRRRAGPLAVSLFQPFWAGASKYTAHAVSRRDQRNSGDLNPPRHAAGPGAVTALGDARLSAEA